MKCKRSTNRTKVKGTSMKTCDQSMSYTTHVHTSVTDLSATKYDNSAAS